MFATDLQQRDAASETAEDLCGPYIERGELGLADALPGFRASLLMAQLLSLGSREWASDRCGREAQVFSGIQTGATYAETVG